VGGGTGRYHRPRGYFDYFDGGGGGVVMMTYFLRK
jgi:hypothetical protein